jgi:hypothetical protein
MLPKEVFDLARDKYLATSGNTARDLEVRARHMEGEFAPRGVAATSTVGGQISLGVEYTKSRCSGAAKALQDACEAHGYKPQLADLEAAWEQLVPQNSEGVRGILQQQLGAHANPGAVSKSLDGALLQARAQGRALAMSDLAHFAARSRRDQKIKMRLALGAAVSMVVGAFVVKLPDLGPWVWVHLKTFMHWKP